MTSQSNDEKLSLPATMECPICNRNFESSIIQDHVNKCIFLNTESEQGTSKRTATSFLNSPQEKKRKLGNNAKSLQPKKVSQTPCTKPDKIGDTKVNESSKNTSNKSTPLAEQMRPHTLDDLVGQNGAFGSGSMIRAMLQQKKIPNMILWGPPGCGKTSLANIVANICKEQPNMRFVKLSATMSGTNDIKEVVKIAKNEAQYKRQTVLFMDEIHRFNKLQQDTFLPHVENGTITLVGATTENPSFSLNNALLSRCRVVVMEKLSVDSILKILERALERSKQAYIVDSQGKIEKELNDDELPRCLVERSCLRWLAEVCDGDARAALGALELAVSSREPGDFTQGPATLTLDDVRDGIKRSHMLYDRRGEEHYNVISALHKSVRAGDDNAALYWCARAMQGGEDPVYVARRLVVASCEDIGLADSSAVVEAVACLQGCQNLGMPDCDVLLAQCAVRLARARKCRRVYSAMRRCQRALREHRGPLPAVPVHLRNVPNRLLKQMDTSGHYARDSFMPEGMEDVNFFNDD